MASYERVEVQDDVFQLLFGLGKKVIDSSSLKNVVEVVF